MKRIVSKTCAPAILVTGLAMAPLSLAAVAQESEPGAKTDELVSKAVRRHVLIVVGIPGDQEHQKRFQKTAGIWRQWLIEIAGVEGDDIILLCSDDEMHDARPATSESITDAVKQLEAQLDPDDSLWVFLLGHGSQDKRHGWFHLPGADLNSAQWAALFAQQPAKEQVFWLTHAASGSFLKPMSLRDRIVITATDADGEVNETRFPHVLAAVMQKQIDEKEESSTPTSVLDLFRSTTQQVNQIFEVDQLVPTEHAQLDDNGDGVGTEIADLASESNDQADASISIVDGGLAGRVFIELQPITEAKTAMPELHNPPSSSAEPKP